MLFTDTFPKGRAVSLRELAEGISSAQGLLEPRRFAELRSVMVPAQNAGHVLFQACAQFLEGPPPPDTRIDAGSVSLASTSTPLDSLTTEEGLRVFLLSWIPPGEEDSFRLQDSAYPERAFSDDAGGLPSMRFEFYLHKKDAQPAQQDGPFFHAATEFFATTVGNAASQWLAMPALEGASAQSRIAVVLPDRRATLGSISMVGDSLLVKPMLQPGLPTLTCIALTTDVSGRRYRFDAHPDGAQIEFQVPATTVRRIEVFLLGPDGLVYDRFFEDEHRCSRTNRVLYLGPVLGSPEKELREALILGEGDRTEFKEWVPLSPDNDKSIEILEAACAFANSRGGTIYVGISRDLQIPGLDRQLRKLTTEKGRALADLRNDYADRLRKWIHEGLVPSLRAEVMWVEIAGHHVLRVDIAPSVSGPHALLKERQVYVRRGASSAKALPSDLGASLLRW